MLAELCATCRAQRTPVQGWSLGLSCAAQNQGITEPQERQGDVASPAQCELLLRDFAGPSLTHQSVHQALNSLVWELDSWETSPFDVQAAAGIGRAAELKL